MYLDKKTSSSFLICLLLAFSAWASNDEEALKNCPKGSFEASTRPAPVDMPTLLLSLKGLKGLDLNPEALREINEIFDEKKVQTKMEQFYRLLYTIALHLGLKVGKTVEIDPPVTRQILLDTKVFENRSIPDHISNVSVTLRDEDEPKYEVRFDQPKTVIPLNKGEGFFLYRNGKCQHNQQLIIDQTFSANIQINRNKNLFVHSFTGANLFGDFGNRGGIDVDIQYVELKSVEFYAGTNLGKVTAYVSDEEFKKNKHNSILKVITKIVPDRTVQPIDW